jgi:multidrug efflux pump subunit AcrB
MWIRSQDKTKLIDVDEVYYMCNPHSIFTTKKGDDAIILGANYKTKKRCLEVLDDIQNKLNRLNKYNCIDVYQMPEK